MLPLDKPSEAVAKVLSDAGVPMDKIVIALYLDLDFEGRFGSGWLLFDAAEKKLWRVGLTTDPNAEPEIVGHHEDERSKKKKKKEYIPSVIFVDSIDLTLASDPYVDNFSTSNRLLYIMHDKPCPVEIPKHGEDHRTPQQRRADEKILEEYRKTGTTLITAYCTNARKRRLFAFIDILERFRHGEVVTEKDQIFEQWAARCPKCGEVYEDQNRRVCTKCMKRGDIIKRLLGYFKPFKAQLATVLICMVATSGISLLSPIISGKLLFDRVIDLPEHATEAAPYIGSLHTPFWLFAVLGLIFGIALLSLAINIVQNRANARMSTRVSKNMKQDIFAAMQRLSLSYFNNNATGRLINRVNYDANRIHSFYIDGIPNLIINGLNFIGLTIFLFIINWKLTLIVFIPVPIIVIIFKMMLPKLWRLYSKQWRRSSSMNAMLGDSLNGIRVVKAFAKEAEESHRFYNYSQRLYDANLQVNMMTLTIFPFISLLIGMSSQAIWGFGGITVMNGTMTYGDLTTYLGYVGMIFGPLQFFTNFTNMLTDTINAAQRMFEVIEAVPEVTDAKDAIDLGKIRGDITFDKVCFHYNPNRPILKDVSFQIRAGDHVGLVGHTGSGKSTIANLITRMYDTISGTILIDGHNIKDIKTSCLRSNMAIVSQEIFLFHGTIADNIRYAKPDATMKEIIDAAKAANAHDFITRLPDGYETVVGIGSRSLSGGEKQRVSIARALLLEPQVLILDEATAAMDTETERLIGQALEKLIEGRTTITIAHRLSTLKDCNYLFAIENGEIAESGTPEELLERKGVYWKLYTLQNEAMKKVLQGM